VRKNNIYNKKLHWRRKHELISEEEEHLQQQAALVKEGRADR
jgi:hypothetical protein